MLKIVVLLSGQGSTFQALLEAFSFPKGLPNAVQISAVISDNPEAYGLIRAQQGHIPTYALDPTVFLHKAAFHAALSACIDRYEPDLIVLAGYMRVLSPKFVQRYPEKILNIHPALLPAYPGLHTYERVLAAGEKYHGTTVHWVTAQVDAGPILAQEKVLIESNETPDSLEKKVKAREHWLYPTVIAQLAAQKRAREKFLYFISDLHLQPSHPGVIEAFIHFLKNRAIYAQALYILGDLFEVWIGDDEDDPAFLSVQAALKDLTTQGISIYFIPGNRDFLIGKRFLAATGIQQLPDLAVVEFGNHRILLAHGDQFCIQDQAYQRFRRWSRTAWFKALFSFLPRFVRRRLALRARQQSYAHTHHIALSLQDVDIPTIQKALQTYQADFMIHGHTHRPALETLPGSSLKRAVLPAWETKGGAFYLTQSGEKRYEPIVVF